MRARRRHNDERISFQLDAAQSRRQVVPPTTGPDPHAQAGGSLDVLFLSASGQLGGAERVLLDLIAALRRAYPAARLGVVVAAEGPLVAACRHAGADVTILPFPPSVARLGDSSLARGGGRARAFLSAIVALPGVLAYVVRLRHVLRDRSPTIVHSNGFKMHVLGSLVRPPRAKLVWHLHDFLEHRRVMKPLLRILTPRADAFVAISRAVEREFRNITGRNVVQVYNSVDLERFAPTGPALDLDAASGVAPASRNVIRIGLVATLADWKGHDVFIRAIALLPRDLRVRAYVVSGAVYQTAGSQTTLDGLRDLATRLGVAEQVAFPGFVSDTAAAMRALDIVVHASTRPEPFGLVIAEAMATGRAVVLSAAGGATELADDGVSALFHEPGDAQGLAGRLEQLVRDEPLRRRIANAALHAARDRFQPSRLGKAVGRLYDDLSAPRADRP